MNINDFVRMGISSYMYDYLAIKQKFAKVYSL